MRDGYIKSRLAAADIAACLIVKFTAVTNTVALATAPTDPIAGVVDTMGGKAGALCDVQLTAIADVRAGGPVAAGDAITADASGRGVKATKIAGQTVNCIGIAQGAHVVDDIMPVLLSPFQIVG